MRLIEKKAVVAIQRQGKLPTAAKALENHHYTVETLPPNSSSFTIKDPGLLSPEDSKGGLDHITHSNNGYLILRRRQIREERTRARDAALARVQDLDKIEDNRSLTINESHERKNCREAAAAADLRVEMDWQQRSRQLWLAAGDANIRYFHQAANERRRANRIEHLRMGDRVITGQTAVEQALADHFRGFFRRGPPNSWR